MKAWLTSLGRLHPGGWKKPWQQPVGESSSTPWHSTAFGTDGVDQGGPQHVDLHRRRHRVGAGTPFVQPVEAVPRAQGIVQLRQGVSVSFAVGCGGL
ncbi:hypothetical protein [Halomonas sp. PA16-9]|uniref:hypothetical protein n=1 Tax=Halomonas sp. PA16-9 TaxID=2576841 RepID=UPI0012DADB05|nr:hypothetical protein FDY98_25640 [Halomonas sp. PA16-9]